MRIRDMEESSGRSIPDDVRSTVIDVLGRDLVGPRGIYYVMYHMEQFGLDLADWPEVRQWFDERKNLMMRDLLKNLASTEEGASSAASFTLKRMRSIGLDWPELDTIERSMRASGDLDEDRDDHRMDDGDDRNERMMDRIREDIAEVMDAMTNTTDKTGRDRFGTASDAMYDLMSNEVGLEMLEDAMREDRHWIIANLVTAFFIGDNVVLRNLIDLLEESPVNWPELRNLPNSVKHLVEEEFNKLLADGELADSIDAARSMAATGLWSEDELMRGIGQAYSHDPGTWLPSGKDTRTIRRNMAAMPEIGATEDQISRILDKSKSDIVRSMLVDVKKGRTGDVSMLISDLMARGKKWSELDAIGRSLSADKGIGEQRAVAKQSPVVKEIISNFKDGVDHHVYGIEPTYVALYNLVKKPIDAAGKAQLQAFMQKNKGMILKQILQFVHEMILDPNDMHDPDKFMSDALGKLYGLGLSWPELDRIKASLESERIKEEPPWLYEDLGNLSKLNAGRMINLFKQNMYQGRRGDGVSRVEPKFRGHDIGANSEILDLGVLKDPMKNIRKAFKDHEDAIGFAVYIGDRIAMLAKTNAHDLAGSSRSNLVTYDLTPWKEAFDRAHEKQYRKPSVATRHSKEEYNFGRGEREYFTAHYEGNAISTGTLSELLSLMKNIAAETSTQLTAKVILSDVDRLAKMRDRSRVRNELENAGKDLRTRLAIYKNSMRPTAATIEDFIRLSLEKRGSTVRFANGTYRLATSGYESMKVEDLLRGKKFKASYSSVDPGKYDSVDVTYAFVPQENQLAPIKAEWTDRGPDGSEYNRVEAVIDPVGYLASELGRGYNSRETAIPAILKMVKANQLAKANNALDALEKLGMDWHEIGTIRKSLRAGDNG